MNNLLSMLEDELNWSRKQSRSRVNALMADQARGAKVSVLIEDVGWGVTAAFL